MLVVDRAATISSNGIGIAVALGRILVDFPEQVRTSRLSEELGNKRDWLCGIIDCVVVAAVPNVSSDIRVRLTFRAILADRDCISSREVTARLASGPVIIRLLGAGAALSAPSSSSESSWRKPPTALAFRDGFAANEAGRLPIGGEELGGYAIGDEINADGILSGGDEDDRISKENGAILRGRKGVSGNRC